ncbi:MAG: hypothetical protein K8I27_09470 [Planctomycetes bacterium]|nr:hypothetical protein [Planctomycetota bacterium]
MSTAPKFAGRMCDRQANRPEVAGAGYGITVLVRETVGELRSWRRHDAEQGAIVR